MLIMIYGVVAVVGLLLMYLFMIAPRMFGRPDMQPFYEYYYAHRGLHDNTTDVPENSMAAFKKAVEAGYGMELDVQLTKDKVPVVFHDYRLERMCGQVGRVDDYTYEELQEFTLGKSKEKIPKFEEVLKLVDGRTPLIVELKMESGNMTLCSVVDRFLSEYKGLYCIETFNPLGLWWYRTHRRSVVRGQLSTAFLREKEYDGPLYFMLQNLMLNFIGRPDFVAYNHMYRDVLARRICCNGLGAVSVGWTIKSKEELERARKTFDWYIFEGFFI